MFGLKRDLSGVLGAMRLLNREVSWPSFFEINKKNRIAGVWDIDDGIDYKNS